MPRILDQLSEAAKAFGDSAIASGENIFGDLSDEDYAQRTMQNRTIIDELFKSDDTIYSPGSNKDFTGNQLYNEYTPEQLEEIRQGLRSDNGTGTYYEIEYPQGLTKRGATTGEVFDRHPYLELGGGKVTKADKLNEFAYFERLVNGNKFLNEKKAFGRDAVPKGHDTQFYQLGLDGGHSEITFTGDPTQQARVKGTAVAVAELDNDQLEIAQESMNVLEESKAKTIELDTFEPEEGTATAAPIQKHWKKYTLKEQEEAANKLSEIDEATTGGSFSPKGAGNYEDILKNPIIKQNAIETYKDIEGEDISNMRERDQEAVLKTFASEQSNNITKMLLSMTNKDARKARRLSTFLKAYRSSDLTPGQFAEGTLTTLTDPMTYATGGVGAIAAKPILKEGLKKAITSGAVDAALTGLAQSVAEQTREKTAGNVDEISGKEIAKHMAIATAFGAGASAAMQKLGNKKLKDMTEVEKELLAEELVKHEPTDEAPKMEGMFKRAVDRAAESEKPDEMTGMFGRAVERAKELEPEDKWKKEAWDAKEVVTELEEDKVHPELRQKISAKEKEKEKEEAAVEDDIKYRNRVKNLVNQRLLPETAEGEARDVPITSKGTGDIYEYQTQGRLSGQALAEKSNRAAEILSIEEGSTKQFTDDILEAQRTSQRAPKKGEHPLKRDLDTTNLLIDSLNGRRFVLEDAGKPLTGKALAEHQEAIHDLKLKRDELKTKMQDTDVETVARRKYGEQFTEEKTVEPFDFENLKPTEKKELLDSRVKDIEKEHNWKLDTKRLEGEVSPAKEKEVDSFLTNLENELNTKIQETKKEKGNLSVSTTALSKKEKNLLNKIATVRQDRLAGMPDDLFKAEIADIFLKNESLGYSKQLTEEKFTAKKARTQKLMEQLDIVLQDATPVKPKEEKVSYKDRKVSRVKAGKSQSTREKLDKEAKSNKWPEKNLTPSTKDKILDDTLNREGLAGEEEKSWSKILKEAIDEKVITRREAKDIIIPERKVDGIDRGIFDYNEFRAEKVARVAERLNEARAEKDLGLDLGVVETGKTISKNEAIDSKFSNIQIASAMTGDESGFKAIGAIEGFDKDLRGIVAHDALKEVGISERAIKKIGDKVDKIAKMALGNKAYTEGEISVVRKLSSFFDEHNIKVSTEKLMELYQAINRHAERNQMSVLSNYAKQMQDAVAEGRIEPVLKFKNFDGTMENIKVSDTVTTKQKFLGQEAEILALPTTKDTKSGKVAALITQSIDAYIERAVRKAIGYKGTASVFDAFITGNKKNLPEIEKAVLNALKTINEKGGLPYILRQIDPKGIYKDIRQIDFTKIKASKLLDTELKAGLEKDFVKGIDTAESFLMSNTGMAINSMLKGTVTNKKGLDALRESATNASRIVEHTPEQLRVYKELGYTDEQIGKRSDLEYSELDKLAGEVLKASTKADLAVIAEKHVPKGKTPKQTRNWHTAMQEIVEAQRRFMEQKKNYKGKRLFVDRNGEDIDTKNKSLVEFFNEISMLDKELLGEELSAIDKAKDFVRRSQDMPKRSPERKAIEAENITEAEPHIVKAKPENKEDILVAHALKARAEHGGVESPKGLHDRYIKNKKLKDDKQCAN